MITFHVLGALDLRGPEGRHLGAPLSGAKRLALLAYLALATRRGLHRRDVLLGLFWPERDQKRARNSLNNMLHHVRRSLGPGVLVTRGQDEVGLAEGVLWCDAVAFEEELEAGRPSAALDLYRGDLLEGLFVPDASPEFDHWLDGARVRLRRRATEAARTLRDEAEAAGSTAEAIRWARKAWVLDAYDEQAARRLIALLGAAGDRAGALRAYDELAKRLAREFDAEPSAETRAAMEGVRERTGAPSDDLPMWSVAVLPFQNLSGAPEAEPFTTGLHDDLLTELSRISALSVIARTSILRYRGTHTPVPEIARELGVGTIVEGAVQMAGGRLRLNVQVIDGKTGSHRWAERFDRKLSVDNLFELQGELSEKIARAVRARLTLAEREREREGQEPTSSLEAYRLHAQGRVLLDQRTPAGMGRSIEYFERALEHDGSYALAWVGLADALTLLYDYGHAEADDVFPRARAAVRRAIDLAPTLAEAHASLGLLHSNRREGSPALRALRRAVQLRPGYAEAHNWLSWNLLVLGYAGDALESARRAVELDPLSPEAVSNLSLSCLVNGRADEALRHAQRTRGLQPDWTTGHLYEGLALYHLGRFAEAAAVLRGLTAEWAGSGPSITLALATVAAGDRDRASEWVSEFRAEGDAFAVGVVDLAIGNRERAFEMFDRVDRWDYWTALSMHHFYPKVLAPLRADPLYHRMRRDMDRAWGRDPEPDTLRR